MRGAVTILIAAALLATRADAFGWLAGVPLEREGATLMYNGRPFGAVGVNKHELLDQYMAELLGRSKEEAAGARDVARASLGRLADIGVRVARVRVSAFWPAQIERTYLHEDPKVRSAFWDCLDQMLDDCDRNGIRVVATIAWHSGAWADLAHESLGDLYTDPRARSRIMLRKWIEDLVTRYADRDTILFWELTNEANLGADLRPMFATEGILKPKLERPAPHLVRGPLVRDGRNNYSSDELVGLIRDLCRLIKSIDSQHLVGTGFSAPRPAAWHLWLGSVRRADKMDWTVDTPEQQADYLRMITPEPLDLVSLHTYGHDFERILSLKLAADSIGAPVYIGELGMPAGRFAGSVYDAPDAVKGLQLALTAMRETGVPLCLLWTWDEWGRPVHEPVLRPKTQPDVVEVLRRANEAARSGAADTPMEGEGLLSRLRALSAEVEALSRQRE